METKYVVFVGPHYPPAVNVEPAADMCLVAQVDCRMEVLLAYIRPACYGRDAEKIRLKKRKEGKEELLRLARILNHERTTTERKEALLKELHARREVQINVYQDKVRADQVARAAAKRADTARAIKNRQ